MARQGNIAFTRTITVTTILVTAIDRETCETFNTECCVNGTIDEAKALKIAQKAIENEHVAVVKIDDIVTTTKMYGITLEKFLENATEITKR